jgi:2-dehydro-3-deoxyphosphooctonate aldolase (KDO 8-P synthase)
LPPFLATRSLKPLITQEIIDTTVPVAFITPTGGKALGYRAELLPKVCDLFLEARAGDLLTTQQLPLAEQSEILVRALAKVGIVALVDEGLRILEKVRAETGLPVLTDVHDAHQVKPVAEVVDVLQTPAFLARQTDLIEAVATSGKPANIKKGQFMAPGDMVNVIDKTRAAAERAGIARPTMMACERGASFGYHNLVVDMRGLAIMRDAGAPVVFDATHSVQLPGGNGTSSGGQREFVPVLSRAAVAVGVSGVFMETHPDPANAKSDGPNAWPLDQLEELLKTLLALDALVKERGV